MGDGATMQSSPGADHVRLCCAGRGLGGHNLGADDPDPLDRLLT